MKNCARRLRIESQIAEKGYMSWEEVVQIIEVFPQFSKMYFQYNDSDISSLKTRMCEDGYKISYESYVDMFSEFVGKSLRSYDKRLYEQIMFG